MVLMIVLIIGVMFYFGPGFPALIGLALLGSYLVLAAIASSILNRVFGPPTKR
jgi:hypothetical protein